MDAVSGWLANKALAVSSGAVEQSLAVADPAAALAAEVTGVRGALDALIDAPFSEARTYLKRGELGRCERKLIQAIATNELHLPARLLYAVLLRSRGEHVLALYEYWTILELFGPSGGHVPALLGEAYGRQHERAAEHGWEDAEWAREGHRFQVFVNDIATRAGSVSPQVAWCSPRALVLQGRAGVSSPRDDFLLSLMSVPGALLGHRRRVIDAWDPHGAGPYRGHRLWRLDGTSEVRAITNRLVLLEDLRRPGPWSAREIRSNRVHPRSITPSEWGLLSGDDLGYSSAEDEFAWGGVTLAKAADGWRSGK